MKKYIKRDGYIEIIKPFIGKDLIKVLTGQRRVGKSYLLLQIIDEIKSLEDKPNIIFINMELYDFASIKNHEDLIKIFVSPIQ